ncbi:hypothetical protein V5738_10090 [Salinisphaera sp. SPP-AMP-43]|uniref:hypothetical protein n=1 Tax=Salinisphaera sp. SPP-AMP-43 TaxID=3121288 RepID=UPI003C6E9FB3
MSKLSDIETPPGDRPPRATTARRLVAAGEVAAAEAELSLLVAEITGVPVVELRINADAYSLNSLNGLLRLTDGRRLFFKYHQEEGEQATIAEYYNGQLLADAGLPVDLPQHASGAPGRQILLYAAREEQRLADVCRAIEAGADGAETSETVVAAQAELDRADCRAALETLLPAEPAALAAEPIHQLFYNRLVSNEARPGFGGRVGQYYVGREFQLAGTALGWQELQGAAWTINGVDYRHSLGALFAEAAERLAPSALADHGAATAHGDAHNANVWYRPGGAPALVTFDPAFAGHQIPVLLAGIKATFHNIFAHPLWLYEPGAASEYYQASVERDGDRLVVEHDWQLTPLRAAFLESKIEHYWRPLLAELDRRGWLPTDWARIIRLALFCCPTLVLDLRAGAGSRQHPIPSTIGFAISIMAGSEPESGADVVSDFIAAIAP